jgi:hypothetical protein
MMAAFGLRTNHPLVAGSKSKAAVTGSNLFAKQFQ